MNVQSKPEKFSVTCGAIQGSRRVYLNGERTAGLSVPMREIALHETANEPPVLVYDTSGPYSDPAVKVDIEAGLAPLRADWIAARGDVEAYDGRLVRPEDNGGAEGEGLNGTPYSEW